MTTTTRAEPVVFDPYDYAFQEDPYPIYAWLREHEPLHHNPTLDLWALTRHADIAAGVPHRGHLLQLVGRRDRASRPGARTPTR